MTRDTLRRWGQRLLVQCYLLVGLVLTTVAFLRIAQDGVWPRENASPMFPGWFPEFLATFEVAVFFKAITPVCIVIFWVAFVKIRAEVRRRYPREA